VAGLALQAACGPAGSGSVSISPASACRPLAVQPQQETLAASTAPTSGFALRQLTHPVGITLDRDGSSVWVLATGIDTVMHVQPSGVSTDFKLPISELGIQLSQAQDGTVWFPEQFRGAVGAIGPDGSVQECKLPGKAREPMSTSVATDGSVWVAAGSTVDRLVGGRFTEYPAGVASAETVEVLADPVGGAWFTMHGTPQLGRVSAQGDVQLTPIGGSGSSIGLLATSDGAVWVADFGGDRVVRVAADRSVTEFKTSAGAKPQSFALGPGGVLWLTESGSNHLGRIRGGRVDEAIATGDWPDHLAITGEGWAWFTEFNDDRLGRVRLPTA